MNRKGAMGNVTSNASNCLVDKVQLLRRETKKSRWRSNNIRKTRTLYKRVVETSIEVQCGVQ